MNYRLGWKTRIAEVLRQTFLKYRLTDYKEPIQIVTDKGSENRGEILEWIDRFEKLNTVIKKTVGENGFH